MVLHYLVIAIDVAKNQGRNRVRCPFSLTRASSQLSSLTKLNGSNDAYLQPVRLSRAGLKKAC
ncbi:hypothetical protein EPI10_014585 [Gossypium australe]|uniref:Uncharacterized protein n=1 Tax=Gossypium australe TaxID=47621 RepID=A0A5B6VHI7_9ROSI|nr:hypothetical protein EPI10_014585 [Gossypium australe]